MEAAWGIERIVNANMANATRRMLASVGADARRLALIAYGGNGPVHAWAIATQLGIGRILVPKSAPAFSALGLLVADYRVDLVRSYVSPLSQVDVDRLVGLMHEVGESAGKELAPAGLADEEITTGLFAQMAYAGQNFDLSVPIPEGVSLTTPGLLDLARRFHDRHEADRGFAFRSQEPIVRGVRLIATGVNPKPPHLGETGSVTDAAAARTGSRPVYFGVEYDDTPTYDGARLGAGATVEGPGLIEEPFTVVVVPPGATARLTDQAAYELTLAGA